MPSSRHSDVDHARLLHCAFVTRWAVLVQGVDLSGTLQLDSETARAADQAGSTAPATGTAFAGVNDGDMLVTGSEIENSHGRRELAAAAM